MSLNRITSFKNFSPAIRSGIRLFADKDGSGCTPLPPSCTGDVPGLSSTVVCCPPEPVGPGVDTNKCGPYKVPEYFCYNKDSYFEAEVELLPYRLPQPSADRK